ncbi:uncharacterized protein [Halyomorpha halys]|uniref:uncharacterized protein n=1 Tax=Halyomorpha halys TaxID=286706 RepID=UPI0006D4E409|nr:uncharacterized protein LOC106686857 isoform X2 [Halyomorpha halys]
MFTEVLSITLVCILSGHQISASMFADDSDVSLPGSSDHETQVEGVRIQDTPGLCCPARRGGCCADSLDCCQVIIDHKPALPVPGFC